MLTCAQLDLNYSGLGHKETDMLEAALIAFLLAVGCAVGAYFALRNVSNLSIKTQDDCSKYDQQHCPTKKNGDCCWIWATHMCRQGKMDDKNECTSQGSVLPLTLFIGACVLLLVSIVMLFVSRRRPPFTQDVLRERARLL